MPKDTIKGSNRLVTKRFEVILLGFEVDDFCQNPDVLIDVLVDDENAEELVISLVLK